MSSLKEAFLELFSLNDVFLELSSLKDAFLELLEDAIDKGGDGSLTVLFLVGKGGGGVESSYNDGLEDDTDTDLLDPRS